MERFPHPESFAEENKNGSREDTKCIQHVSEGIIMISDPRTVLIGTKCCQKKAKNAENCLHGKFKEKDDIMV